MEYAPAAIQHLFDTVKEAIPAAVMGGILGDSAHTYGYHRGRNYLPRDDYSVQTPPDKKGSGEAACGLDISWSKVGPQYDVSQRLIDAKNDSRMYCIREFYGSTDGVNVTGWDFYYGRPETSDDTHLWHIHLSVLREFCENEGALQQVADVIIGRSSDDLNKEETEKMINQAINSLVYGGNHGAFTQEQYAWVRDENNGVFDRLSNVEGEDTPKALIERFMWSYHFGGDRPPWTHKAYPSVIQDTSNGVDDRLKRLEG